MAVVATAPEAAAMGVLCGMTVDTISRHLGATGHRRAMASCAFQILMSAMQNEARLDRMVESPAHPTIRIVAPPAVGSQSLLVHIIGLMTRETRSVLVRKSVITMAGLTRRNRMKPEQRESR